MRERTRKEGSYGIQQNGMGQECERQHDTCRDTQLDEHQAQGRALAILGMVEMEHPTLLYHPDGDADEHQPYEPYRGEMVYKMARKPADALGLVSEWANDSGIAAVSSHETRITTTSAIPNDNAR